MNDANFSLRLLDWYTEHGRRLPWRDTCDPYRIWISEIILQQTRVSQGYDYFLRFVRRFPDVQSLSAATDDEVMRQWQGLGYYSRARNLHKAARQITEMGHFPTDYDAIRRLHGVGDYTAAAIASFAFGLPHAVVDGNVYRVLARYFGIDTPIDTTAGKKLFTALAQEMLPAKCPADYNQAIMDFGALQCTPKSPCCAVCPLADTCQALAEGRVDELPVKARKTKVRDRYFTYINIEYQGETLLQKRGEGDIWQGLYQPPMRETPQPMTLPEVEAWAGHYGTLTLLRSGFLHQLTHQRLHADFYHLDSTTRPPFDGIWVPDSDRDRYPVPRLLQELMRS